MTTRTEYRVMWQREGFTKRSKRFRSLAQAERKALILQGRVAEATGEDPDHYACCPGQYVDMCGCGGITKGEAWAQTAERVPRLVFGPVIQTRQFSATPWAAVESEDHLRDLLAGRSTHRTEETG